MSQLPSSTLPLQPPSLQEATKRSTVAWQNDLEALFHLAKDRFPDVVWELFADDSPDPHTEEVWGHKGKSCSLSLSFSLFLSLSLSLSLSLGSMYNSPCTRDARAPVVIAVYQSVS